MGICFGKDKKNQTPQEPEIDIVSQISGISIADFTPRHLRLNDESKSRELLKATGKKGKKVVSFDIN